MKKLLAVSFMISLFINVTFMIIPVFPKVSSSQIYTIPSDEQIDQSLEDIEEVIDIFLPDDGPQEKKVDQFFDYLKKAAKLIIPAALALGAAIKIFKTFF